MEVTESFLFQVGAIMAFAFVGATLASRYKQSTILGFLIGGILIGPHMHIQVGDFRYDGLIHDTTLVSSVSQLGLILLMFFVGLEFSVTKLRKVQTPAIILSVFNIGINLFIGILLGTALGWPLIDTIFLSAVMAMSCAAVAVKTLMELNRLDNSETGFLLGVMVVEDFISAVFLALVGGLIVKTNALDTTILGFLIGAAVFVVFFALLALFVIPRAIAYMVRMRNEEMFVLFALGLVCLSAALAELCGVPGMTGAFFIGMVFSETKLTERMDEKLSPFRDTFVAVFFIAFGMMIDPGMFPAVIGIVVVACLLVILNDVFITAALSFFLGFSSRQAVSVGSCLSARGAESIMYADVGSKAVGVTKGAELHPIAGAFTFIVSGLCPILIRRSYRMADALARRMPLFIKYSANIISRTLSKVVNPSGLRTFRGSRWLVALQAAFMACLIVVIATSGEAHIAAFAAAAAVSVALWAKLQSELDPVVRHIMYTNLGTVPGHHVYISRYVASLVLITLLTAASVAFLFSLYWPSVLVVLLAYLLWFVFLMKVTYDRTCDDSRYKLPARPVPPPVAPVPMPLDVPEQPQFNYRRRWKDL
mgnify:CR=1 FL=1